MSDKKQNKNDLYSFNLINRTEKLNKLKEFFSRLGKAGEIADRCSDLILFHNRVKENAEKRYM